MKTRLLALAVLASSLALPHAAVAADKFTVTVTNDLAIARPSETIALPWSEVQKAMPNALLQKISVKDAAGRVLPYQVINLDGEAKDPRSIGAAYGDLLFQHDFAAGEKSATFTIERTTTVSAPFPTKAYARFIPERLDDFAWENDKIAHRIYGPALAAPDEPKRGKEVLVTSGIDIWCKAVAYPIVDRWYNKGHDHYHKDEGEGIDMYNVGTSRGCGGTGIWDGQQLYVGRNFKTWKVLANGPVRAIFELTYDAWDAAGAKVSEVKRFTVDAGRNLDLIESTFTVEGGGAKDLTFAIGINKDSSDRGQNSKSQVTKGQDAGWLAQWEVQATNGSLGEAVVVPDNFAGFAEDKVNQLILAKATSGKAVRYYVGGGWTRGGDFTSNDDWTKYVAAEAARAKSPVKVTVSQ